MINSLYVGWLLSGLLILTNSELRAETLLPSPRITSITVNHGQALLTWTNGRPTYQVQMRSGFGQNWVNVGGPTSNYSATFPVGGTTTYFRVISDFTARYQVLFSATWSQ